MAKAGPVRLDQREHLQRALRLIHRGFSLCKSFSGGMRSFMKIPTFGGFTNMNRFPCLDSAIGAGQNSRRRANHARQFDERTGVRPVVRPAAVCAIQNRHVVP